MKHIAMLLGVSCLVGSVMVGCGGHEGGVVEVPLNENPYQISDQEQQSINAGVVDTAALTEEEIAAIEEEKKKAAVLEQETESP